MYVNNNVETAITPKCEIIGSDFRQGSMSTSYHIQRNIRALRSGRISMIANFAKIRINKQTAPYLTTDQPNNPKYYCKLLSSDDSDTIIQMLNFVVTILRIRKIRIKQKLVEVKCHNATKNLPITDVRTTIEHQQEGYKHKLQKTCDQVCFHETTALLRDFSWLLRI